MTVGPPRRAPRLGPDDRLASHLTRRGRFRKIDPRKARPLPKAARILATVGWAVLVEESLRRAYRSVRRPQGDPRG